MFFPELFVFQLNFEEEPPIISFLTPSLTLCHPLFHAFFISSPSFPLPSLLLHFSFHQNFLSYLHYDGLFLKM